MTIGTVIALIKALGSGGGGSGGGALVVNVTESTGEQGEFVYTCDKTAGEMWSAFIGGTILLVKMGIEAGLFTDASHGEGYYSFTASHFLDDAGFEASADDEFPAYIEGIV